MTIHQIVFLTQSGVIAVLFVMGMVFWLSRTSDFDEYGNKIHEDLCRIIAAIFWSTAAILAFM